ncbi:DUF2007 domain-containing protein [Gilvimarinus agarilyticus]|uniref:putative signal transducing protein n=1 Tax=unclassified Gilvimarinus TaxID=2642066 RepID=UPI001C0A3768|nr:MULTISPECIES: DUF2007 domain-containing protein [unclassified Gilvimarinus]MBU2885173.1 DUF2007 domain-containing protein [Gilvimarinus agarilyticus]MDO6570072.1 DUF2007 domain-containing protein [Gilvimarinus sp. 2_MG-2023]MDO6745623.1 DUF2007 domain-containing protein [Gilvimarinus sp. 1_MG-2023]
MDCIYNAANTIEGQLVLDQLHQQGIRARMDGEYLQGGVGELQALGLIRILVARDDVAQAQAVVQAWDKRTVVDGPSDVPAQGSGASGKRGLGVLVGVLVGAALALALLILNAD